MRAKIIYFLVKVAVEEASSRLDTQILFLSNYVVYVGLYRELTLFICCNYLRSTRPDYWIHGPILPILPGLRESLGSHSINIFRTLFGTPKCAPNALLRLKANIPSIKAQAWTCIPISGHSIIFNLTGLRSLLLSITNPIGITPAQQNSAVLASLLNIQVN